VVEGGVGIAAGALVALEGVLPPAVEGELPDLEGELPDLEGELPDLEGGKGLLGPGGLLPVAVRVGKLPGCGAVGSAGTFPEIEGT
jgi:hypothetical protein